MNSVYTHKANKEQFIHFEFLLHREIQIPHFIVYSDIIMQLKLVFWYLLVHLLYSLSHANLGKQYISQRLEQWFSNFRMLQNYLETLFKCTLMGPFPEFLIQYTLGGFRICFSDCCRLLTALSTVCPLNSTGSL